MITVVAVCICRRGKRKTYHVQSFKDTTSLMDNGIAITNLAYQPDQDAVSKKDEQITEFVNPICAEILYWQKWKNCEKFSFDLRKSWWFKKSCYAGWKWGGEKK